MKVAKVLLINQGETDNIGDQVINLTLHQICLKNNISTDSVLFWDSKAIFNRIPVFLRNIVQRLIYRCPFILDFLNYLSVRKRMKTFDYSVALIGGGALLEDHPGFASSSMVWAKLLMKKEIPFYFIGISGRDCKHRFMKKRFNFALTRCNGISVRDNFTASMLQDSYEIRCNVSCSPDIAFAYEHFTGSGFLEESRRIIICVPIAYSTQMIFSDVHTELEFFNLLGEIIKTHLKESDILVVTSTCEEDCTAINRFYQYAQKEFEQEVNIVHPSDINSFINLSSRAKVVVSCRMHALILGMISGAYVEPIPHNSKLLAFKNEWVTKPLSELQVKAENSVTTCLQQIIHG